MVQRPLFLLRFYLFGARSLLLVLLNSSVRQIEQEFCRIIFPLTSTRLYLFSRVSLIILSIDCRTNFDVYYYY